MNVHYVNRINGQTLFADEPASYIAADDRVYYVPLVPRVDDYVMFGPKSYRVSTVVWLPQTSTVKVNLNPLPDGR